MRLYWLFPYERHTAFNMSSLTHIGFHNNKRKNTWTLTIGKCGFETYLRMSDTQHSTCPVCGKRPRCRCVCYNRFKSHRINVFVSDALSILFLYYTLSRIFAAVLRQGTIQDTLLTIALFYVPLRWVSSPDKSLSLGPKVSGRFDIPYYLVLKSLIWCGFQESVCYLVLWCIMLIYRDRNMIGT
jgi:hypothetical protein